MKKYLFPILFLFASLNQLFGDQTNALFVCENGLQMFEWDLKLIQQANLCIEVEADFFGGDICQQLLQAIEKRMQEVKALVVHIMASPYFLENEDRSLIERLVKEYPQQFHFLYAHDVPFVEKDMGVHHCHVKFVIIDERYFSFGGTNLDETLCSEGTFTPPRKRSSFSRDWVQTGARDQDVLGRGPLAKQLRHHFFLLWAMWESQYHRLPFQKDHTFYEGNNRYFPVNLHQASYNADFESLKLIATPNIQLIVVSPGQKPNPITQSYVKVIKQAKELCIGNLYFNPAPSIMEALQEASIKRKIPITLVTNGPRDNTSPHAAYFCWANRINYVPLFYGREFRFWEGKLAAKEPIGNVKIFEYNVLDVLYHKKVLVADQRIVILGSYNLGIKSDAYDVESVLIIDSAEIAKKVLEVIARDKKYSVEITPQEARGWYFDPITSFLGMQQKQIHGFL